MPRLTPYDTGEVLQPHLHVPFWQAAEVMPDCAFGYVDFDDDEGMTQAVVSSRRLDDGYMLIIEDLVTEETHVIHLKRKEG